MVTYYEIDINKFMEHSPVPLAIRIRLALSKQGMKFIDDGKLSLIANKNPIPLGKAVTWEEFSQPGKRFYRQTIEKIEEQTCQN